MDLSVEEPPATPPASEILQASTPVTVEITAGVHGHVVKNEGVIVSVRRQLLMDDTQEETSTAAKKTKQGE